MRHTKTTKRIRISESQLRRIIREELLMIERIEMSNPFTTIETAAENVQYTSGMTIEDFFDKIKEQLSQDHKDLFERIRQTTSHGTNIELVKKFNAKKKRANVTTYATTLPSAKR